MELITEDYHKCSLYPRIWFECSATILLWPWSFLIKNSYDIVKINLVYCIHSAIKIDCLNGKKQCFPRFVFWVKNFQKNCGNGSAKFSVTKLSWFWHPYSHPHYVLILWGFLGAPVLTPAPKIYEVLKNIWFKSAIFSDLTVKK